MKFSFKDFHECVNKPAISEELKEIVNGTIHLVNAQNFPKN